MLAPLRVAATTWPEEVRKWEENDPIGIFRAYLIKKKLASDAELDSEDQSAEQEVAEAVEFAESSPEPGPEELYRHIYYEEEGR